MSDVRQNNTGASGALGGLTTEQLEEMIRIATLDDEWDIDYLDKLTDAYLARPDAVKLDADAAWERFQQVRNDKDRVEYVKSIADIAEAEIQAQMRKNNNSRRPTRLSGWKHRRVLRIPLAAAVAVVTTMATVVTAIAVPPIRHAIARWTDEIFTFEKGGEYIIEEPTPYMPVSSADKEVDYPDMLRVLEEYGITEPLAPTWLPDGFEEKEFVIDGDTTLSKLFALFEKDENHSVIVSIKSNPNGTDLVYEKDDRKLTVYEKEGVTHYIMTNNARIKAAWTNDEYDCYISVSESVGVDTLYKIIDSIYER
ncbi:MAG: DUF4367 domain-containing protein [Oscillospiraceae bacterium]|jgi:hypothetical protein|nr:DUF4367 domain-containing protein [Oscillospiraceae bacterium]